MKHFSLFTWIVLWFCTPLFAQESESTLLTPEEFSSVKTTLFGNVISPQSNTNLGNYVAADLKENKVNFNGNIAFEDGSFLGVKLAGAASEGFVPIFTGSQLNPTFEVDLQYNFTGGRKVLRYRLQDLRAYRKKQAELDKKYDEALLKLRVELSLAKLDSVNLRNKHDDLNNKIKALANSIDPLEVLKRDSLTFERDKVRAIIDDTDAKLKQLRDQPQYVREEILNNQKAIEKRALRDTFIQTIAGIAWFDLNWFSLGFGLSNQTFNLFNDSTGLSRKSYTGDNVRVQYTRYNRSPVPYESYYLSLGVGLTLHNNLDKLSQIEHMTRTEVGSDSARQFIDKKTTAFQGIYEENQRTYKVFLDAYWFLFKDDAGAFHFYPDFEILQDSKTSFNLNIGFLLAFGDKAGKNKVNAEAYLRLNDIFKESSMLDTGVKRSEVGIRVTVPFQLN